MGNVEGLIHAIAGLRVKEATSYGVTVAVYTSATAMIMSQRFIHFDRGSRKRHLVPFDDGGELRGAILVLLGFSVILVVATVVDDGVVTGAGEEMG